MPDERCDNCKKFLVCSKCGINHSEPRPKTWPMYDAHINDNGLVVADRNICGCECTIIVRP